MKGLELSKEYFLNCAKTQLEKDFGEVIKRVAVGLCGEGSECFGFDDEVSIDHDFEPGFCVWLTDEDYDKFGFKLERWYAKLPKEYKGFRRQTLSPVGGNRHGIMRISDFYTRFLGAPSAPNNYNHWLALEPCLLASAVNGEVFLDNLGRFSFIREQILKGYPEDVRLKKISAHLAYMAQSGLYNYTRCIKHGEQGGARLAVYEFVKNAISVIYLLNNKYQPFYKWAFRGIRESKKLFKLEKPLITLMQTKDSDENFSLITGIIENVCADITEELLSQGLVETNCIELEKVAYNVQNKIKDANLRNMHVMSGVN